jgi:uncharacterized membrane protein
VKPWWTSKTIWLNIITLAMAMLTFLADQPWYAAHKDAAAATLTIIGVLGIILRFMTNQPIGDK